MTKQTIIYLHSTELAQVSLIVCEEEEIEKSVLRCHLADLTPADKENEIIVVVPASDVLLTEATLPKLNRQRLLQALPFALEEQLIDDVDALHFAITDYQPNGTVPVAIVARKKMDEWMMLLKQYDIVPHALYSAVFLLPLVEKSWSACKLQETVTVRQQAFQGFYAEPAQLPLLLDLAIQAAPVKPECIHIYNTVAAPLDLKLEPIIINEIYLSEENWLETIPAWLNPTQSINLLQGPYQPKGKTSDTKKIWQYAAYATLTWILLAFFGNLISYFILHHKANVLETEINQIYKKNFPTASAIVAPRERMESKLTAIKEQSNKNIFLILLAKVGDPLSKMTTIQLKTLDFRDQQLTLEVTANRFDDLDSFTRALTQQGLQVKQQNAAVMGEKVKASLFVSRGNA